MGPAFSAETVGKPNKEFFERVITSIPGFQNGEDGKIAEGVAVIGDDIEADLSGGAVEMGLWRVLGWCFPLSSGRLTDAKDNLCSENG